MRRPRTPLAVGLLVCGLVASAPAAGPARVPGTGVTLVPPAGFSSSERFPGYELPERAASIMVTEIDGSAHVMRNGMTDETLATRGMRLIESKKVTIDGGEALVLHVSQAAAGVEFEKWMLVAGDSKRIVMVVGTFPAEAEDLSGPIRASVLSASWNAAKAANVDPYEGLAFRVTPTAAMKLAKRMSNMLVFTESGEVAPSGRDQAVLGIGGSLSEIAIGSVETFSKERAAKTSNLGELHGIRGRPVTIGGLKGYELIAEAADTKTEKPVRMYQLVLLDGRTYYLAQGFVHPDRVPDFVAEFRRLTSTFRLVGKRPARNR